LVELIYKYNDSKELLKIKSSGVLWSFSAFAKFWPDFYFFSLRMGGMVRESSHNNGQQFGLAYFGAG